MGKYQFGVTVEIPLGSPDEFYVVSNNLLRFLSPLGFDSLAIFPDRFYADFSPMSESFITELSSDGTKMYIHCGGGGCLTRPTLARLPTWRWLKRGHMHLH